MEVVRRGWRSGEESRDGKGELVAEDRRDAWLVIAVFVTGEGMVEGSWWSSPGCGFVMVATTAGSVLDAASVVDDDLSIAVGM